MTANSLRVYIPNASSWLSPFRLNYENAVAAPSISRRIRMTTVGTLGLRPRLFYFVPDARLVVWLFFFSLTAIWQTISDFQRILSTHVSAVQLPNLNPNKGNNSIAFIFVFHP